MALVVKNLPANAQDIRDVDLIPGLGRSPGRGHDNPLQYSFLENPKDRGARKSYSPRGHKESDTTGDLARTYRYTEQAKAICHLEMQRIQSGQWPTTSKLTPC